MEYGRNGQQLYDIAERHGFNWRAVDFTAVSPYLTDLRDRMTMTDDFFYCITNKRPPLNEIFTAESVQKLGEAARLIEEAQKMWYDLAPEY